MSVKVLSAWKEYNANSRNHYVPDCVCRSISLAYGLSYDETHKLLIDKMHEKRKTKYNIFGVWNKLIEDQLGYVRKLTGPDCSLSGNNITLAEFCEERPEGTYIVLNGKQARGTDHLATVIDGDIYDSWDSSKQYVSMVWVIEESKQTESIFKSDYSQLYSDLSKVLDPFLEQQQKKMPYAIFQYSDLHFQNNDSQGLGIRFYMEIDTKGDVLAYDGQYQKRIILKLNPRKTYEEQAKQVIEKARVAIREWIYGYRKDIEDLQKMRNLPTHPNFRGSRFLLTKFPDWIVPLVTEAFDNGEGYVHGDRYEVWIDAMDGDPRKEELPEVSFYADTIPQLRYCFDDYKSKFYRINYDY